MDCPFCTREMPLTEHHLVPKCQHKRKSVQKLHPTREARNVTIDICADCHGTIHKFWTNKELALSYYTPELLLADEKFAAHIQWLSKQKNRRLKTRS